jgi:polyhydroxybutyrate depolymerase
MNRLVALTAIALPLCSCQSPMRSGEEWQPGTYKRKTGIQFNGLSRSYLLHIPGNTPSGEWPLVVVLHGAFSTAKEMEQQSGFSRVADQQGFCVAYPNGIGLFGKLQHWNAGHCCGKAAKGGVDDVGFINSVIDNATAACPIDPSRIYLVGYSNGGMMAYRYAEEQADRLAAVAVFAGAINSTVEDEPGTWTPPKPSRPLPMLIMHGMSDDVVPVHGGRSPAKANGRNYASLERAREFWETNNAGRAEVRVELLENWGHMWPGPWFTEREDVPETMRGYDGAQEIWDFFRQR